MEDSNAPLDTNGVQIEEEKQLLLNSAVESTTRVEDDDVPYLSVSDGSHWK